jgi:hypothetical protein
MATQPKIKFNPLALYTRPQIQKAIDDTLAKINNNIVGGTKGFNPANLAAYAARMKTHYGALAALYTELDRRDKRERGK